MARILEEAVGYSRNGPDHRAPYEQRHGTSDEQRSYDGMFSAPIDPDADQYQHSGEFKCQKGRFFWSHYASVNQFERTRSNFKPASGALSFP
jgi:hypothetical protein